MPHRTKEGRLVQQPRPRPDHSPAPAPAPLGSVEVPEVDAEIVAVAEGVAIQPAGLQLQLRPSLVFKSWKIHMG